MQTTELGENDSTIIIRTNKNQYFTNETINVSVTNKLDLPVNYFKCDNVDLSPVQVLQFSNGGWIEKEIPYLCTAMGPSGYFGVLNVKQAKNNSVSLPNMNGLIKLQFKFRLGEYYITYYSNEFTIKGGEN